MKIKPVLVLATIMVSILLGACAAPGQKALLEISCDDFYDNNHINQTLEAQAGETFEVKLGSNPTTGFRWSETTQISDTAIIVQEGHEFIGPESESPPPPGTPGQEVWVFKALGKGSSTVYLEYSQPWDGGGKKEWTCIVDVIVE